MRLLDWFSYGVNVQPVHHCHLRIEAEHIFITTGKHVDIFTNELDRILFWKEDKLSLMKMGLG